MLYLTTVEIQDTPDSPVEVYQSGQLDVPTYQLPAKLAELSQWVDRQTESVGIITITTEPIH